MRSTVILCASAFFFPSVWVAKGFPRTAAGAPPELLLSDGRKPVLRRFSQPHLPPPTKKEFIGYSQLCWEITGPQKEVFLVQPQLRWRKLRHHAAPSAQKPILSFFPNLALLSQNVQSGWFFHFETGFSVKWWISLPQDERMGSIIHSTAGKPKCFPTEARETPASSFFSHKMKKCARDSFCAFGHWDRGYFPAEQRITSKSS